MNHTETERFKQEIFNYCERNLVKLFVFIPSPYVKVYVLDKAGTD